MTEALTEAITIYKIRRKDKLYSRGRVEQRYNHDHARGVSKLEYGVSWRANGKEWNSEELVKKHLLTCIKKGVDMTGWEIMEFTQQPSKSMNEWFDAKMTFAVIKASI